MTSAQNATRRSVPHSQDNHSRTASYPPMPGLWRTTTERTFSIRSMRSEVAWSKPCVLAFDGAGVYGTCDACQYTISAGQEPDTWRRERQLNKERHSRIIQGLCVLCGVSTTDHDRDRDQGEMS